MDKIYKLKDLTVVHPYENEVGTVRKTLVHHKGNFYIVSENTVLVETLIFPATPTGETLDWSEVGGGQGLTSEQVLEDFENYLYG